MCENFSRLWLRPRSSNKILERCSPSEVGGEVNTVKVLLDNKYFFFLLCLNFTFWLAFFSVVGGNKSRRGQTTIKLSSSREKRVFFLSGLRRRQCRSKRSEQNGKSCSRTIKLLFMNLFLLTILFLYLWKKEVGSWANADSSSYFVDFS